METLVVFLMYFTIENPDLKVIEELNDNRKLIEKTNEDKLNLLFELSQEVKQPIKSIEKISDEALLLDDMSEIKEKLKIIKANSKQLSLISNNILNVSNMDKDMSSCMISFDVPNSYNSVISECVDNSIMSYKDGRVTISSSGYFAKGDKLELKLKLYLNDSQEMKISRLAINNLLMKSE